MGGRKGVCSTPAGEGGAGEPPLASDALEVSADRFGALLSTPFRPPLDPLDL